MTTNEILDTRTVDDVVYRVYLEQDSDCESPRDNDSTAGVIVTEGGPRNPYYAWPTEDGDMISAWSVRCAMEDHSFRVVARWLRMFHGATVVLPLHSGEGDRPSAGDATDTPDAGNYLGVTFDQPSTRKTTGVAAEDMASALSVDVDEYSTWARGDCWGYVIEKDERPVPAALEFARWLRSDRSVIGEDVDLDALYAEFHNDDDEPVWVDHESCWGFVGDEYARQEALRALGDL